ncbi:hypothetical protein EPN28_01370 [Patescibacteria group bacterium]|nr:MAG: hypothetical protein EPN28_01370 [Patescibacteria group bacterium]
MWKKILGYGVLLYVLMFVIVSVFIGFKIYGNSWAPIVTAVIGGVISYILAGRVKPASAGAALGYGIGWVVVGVILDFIITMRFNPVIFSAWQLWLGYALVLLAPLLAVKKPAAAPSAPTM